MKPVGRRKKDLGHVSSPENHLMISDENIPSSPLLECSFKDSLADEKPTNGSFAQSDQVVSPSFPLFFGIDRILLYGNDLSRIEKFNLFVRIRVFD